MIFYVKNVRSINLVSIVINVSNANIKRKVFMKRLCIYKKQWRIVFARSVAKFLNDFNLTND